MIVDKLDNIMFYEPMVKNLAAGMEAVNALKVLEEGRYQFEGGFFLVQKGETKPLEDGTFEAHRKYVDVQIVMDGCEEVAWADLPDLEIEIPYNPEKDAERLNGDKSHHMLISEGMFYIAFPHDGHKPVSHTGERHQFLKIVMKLPV